jgi:hypothetical protein
MRCTITSAAAAAALMVLSATGAHAEAWCGYAARANSIIECGYSTNTECENAIGKGGMCFVDPEFALDRWRSTPAAASRLTASRDGSSLTLSEFNKVGGL